jgi:hypothetical protein
MNTRVHMKHLQQNETKETKMEGASASFSSLPSVQMRNPLGSLEVSNSSPSRALRPIRNPQSAIRNPSGIALVITLLMLSVITFLAVAFLVLTRTHRDSVTNTLDVEAARAMSEAAQARAQSEIVAHLMAHHDLFNFDYSASHNFINPAGFVKGVAWPTNVNYDYDSTGAAMSPINNNGRDWAQNIANLWYDPRPPVFIRTNANLNLPADFRFWVDLNRNGRFETNGFLPYIQKNGQPTNFDYSFNGEPEWIGELQYPEYHHSATNRFIGRYAYLVLPIGKTLDLNYIHNYSKSLASGTSMPVPDGPALDGFIRDQGVGSWELNLAAYLCDLNQNTYPLPAAYKSYSLSSARNVGYAFDDAYSFLRFRYNANYGAPYPLSLASFFPAIPPASYTPNYLSDGIDEYGTASFSFYPSTAAPWPGSYATNYFYNIQDIFDITKSSLTNVNRLLSAGAKNDSYDRYTFQRLLATIGTGSAPELQTFVYGDVTTTNPAVQPPTVPRPKVNINYDNSYQITNGLNTSPSVLSPWSSNAAGPLAFFTNAAESLLRSQNFRITNYDNLGNIIQTNPLSYIHFGLTNIPVYNSLNPSIRYTEQLHRMLQVAANIYDATRSDAVVSNGVLPHPSVFRPLFYTTNYGKTNQVLYIVGYTQVTNDAGNRIANMLPPEGGINRGIGLKPPWDTTIGTNDNVWGIPWVVGAVKGLPAFDRYVSGTSWMITRKLLFTRYQAGTSTGANGNYTNGITSKPPQFTNQFFIMSISNTCGMDAWNSYTNTIATTNLRVFATNFVTVTLNNNAPVNPRAYVFSFSNAFAGPISNNFWRGFSFSSRAINPFMSNAMLAYLQTNPVPLPQAYFSQSVNGLLPISANMSTTNFNLGQLITTNGGFQSYDLTQTTWPFYNWTLSVTNVVMYALVDAVTGQAYDFVNLGPFGTNLVLTNILTSATIPPPVLPGGGSGSGPVSSANYWDPTLVPFQPTRGVLNQITNGISHDSYFAAELRGSNSVVSGSSNIMVNSNLYFSCSNDLPATVFTGVTNILLVNDPLVHYTVGDLTPPKPVSSMVLQNNDRYEAWPLLPDLYDPYTQYIGMNTTLKDPQITSSDAWNFPANKFPSVGWLGRVHRGTPWQTIFLKADPDQFPTNGVNTNQQSWISGWVSTLDTYPTNDYALLDLFTAAPNDNASRGLLSVNQTNSAPWYALFSGISVNPNLPPLDPTNVPPLLDGEFVIGRDSNGNPITNFFGGINNLRAVESDQTFHNIGSVFKSPMLSVNSPFLTGQIISWTDEEVEAIPQQVAGLLKLGQPQFVIYGYGQALKPKDIYFGSQSNLFNLCTNYQITGEFLTRTVCHVVGDPSAANLKIQVDSFNIIPAD